MQIFSKPLESTVLKASLTDTIALDGMATWMFSQNEHCCKYASVSQIQDTIFAM